MNLISCKGCGNVYDQDCLDFPEPEYDSEDTQFPVEKFMFSDGDFFPYVLCPVCDGPLISTKPSS